MLGNVDWLSTEKYIEVVTDFMSNLSVAKGLKQERNSTLYKVSLATVTKVYLTDQNRIIGEKIARRSSTGKDCNLQQEISVNKVDTATTTV